jgi:hypothetical protein
LENGIRSFTECFSVADPSTNREVSVLPPGKAGTTFSRAMLIAEQLPRPVGWLGSEGVEARLKLHSQSQISSGTRIEQDSRITISSL